MSSRGAGEGRESEGRRQFSVMLDYEFGHGVGRALPEGLRFAYSKKSDGMRHVFHGEQLFATVKANGAVALTVYGASVLMRSRAYVENTVTVEDDAVPFVKQGKSVFCKFVKRAGRRVLPSGEVAVLDPGGAVIAVGSARLRGDEMREFKAGVAVKVRSAVQDEDER